LKADEANDATPLSVTSVGEGADLVLLHGWGMHSGIWHDLLQPLQEKYRIHQVDLPGHGRSQSTVGDFDLLLLAQMIRQSLTSRLQGPAFWLGWSLGGLAAMQIALQQPAMIRALVLVATTPRFVRADDWPHAMSPDVLGMFADQLAEDQEATLHRFLALQVKGSDEARESLRRLRRQVLDNAVLDPSALHSGLAILQQADLRSRLHELNTLPVLQVFGEHDMLVPRKSAADQAALFGNSRSVVIEGAGHAPFVSHRDQFLKQLMMFLDATE
jgi:pimeloyl-[acyl-carrier protein] methyl ester esterase